MERQEQLNKQNHQEPLSRSDRNKILYKDINKTELDDYDIKSNATVIGNNRNSIDVDKIKSILDTHYKDGYRKKSISLEKEIAKDRNVEPEEPSKVFETKEYDINVVLDKARDEKKENYEEDKVRKLRDTQFDILKDLDIDDKPLDDEDKVINHNKSSELKNLINTISINEKELEDEKAKLEGESISDDEESDTEEDLFANLLGGDNTSVLEGAKSDLSDDIDKLKIEKISVEDETIKNNYESEDKLQQDLDKIGSDSKDDIDKSFFTKSNAIREKDFEDDADFTKDVDDSSHNGVKILIIILLIIFLVGIYILIRSFN